MLACFLDVLPGRPPRPGGRPIRKVTSQPARLNLSSDVQAPKSEAIKSAWTARLALSIEAEVSARIKRSRGPASEKRSRAARRCLPPAGFSCRRKIAVFAPLVRDHHDFRGRLVQADNHLEIACRRVLLRRELDVGRIPRAVNPRGVCRRRDGGQRLGRVDRHVKPQLAQRVLLQEFAPQPNSCNEIDFPATVRPGCRRFRSASLDGVRSGRRGP